MIYVVFCVAAPSVAWLWSMLCRLKRAHARIVSMPRFQVVSRGRHTAHGLARHRRRAPAPLAAGVA